MSQTNSSKVNCFLTLRNNDQQLAYPLLSVQNEETGYLGGSLIDPDISFDGRWLFYNSDIGVEDIWQIPLIPIVDLNADGIVDSADMVIIVDNWGTDNSLCDIGPMPWGDGIVDVQDLIVLAEHLFEEFPPAQ